jgi:hypothetical protein
MRVIPIVLACVCSVSTASVVSAGSITLNFAGIWGFYNAPDEEPLFYAEAAKMGITNGTPLTFSLTLNDSASGADPANGSYGVSGFQMIGPSLRVYGGAVTPGLHSTGFVSGTFFTNSLRGPLGAFRPDFLQFGFGFHLPPPSGPISTLENYFASHSATDWTLFVDFRNPARDSGQMYAGMHFVGATVPEASTLSLMAAGVAVFVRRRRRPR